MWVEIIATSILTAAATHLGPKLYAFLRAKVLKRKSPKGPPLGNYIIAVDKQGESKTFKLKISPAVQHTRLGSDAGNHPMEVLATIPFPKRVENWTDEEIEAEVAEAAKDREITPEDMAAYVAKSIPYATPRDELIIEFDVPRPDPWAMVPPDYSQTPESQARIRAAFDASEDEIASAAVSEAAKNRNGI